MKHETINSIGVIAGLVLGIVSLSLTGVTAWHQFAPKKDSITVATEGRVNVGARLEVEPFGGINPETGESQPLLGPVTWKIRVHNTSDRSVSLVDFRGFLLTADDARIMYSAMRERLSPIDPSLPVQSLPENIPANESRAYLVSLFVPFSVEVSDENKCTDLEVDLRELERCYFRKGRDLFGNQVQYTETGGDTFIAIMKGAFKGPRFAILIETADGTQFSTQLSFLPGGL